MKKELLLLCSVLTIAFTAAGQSKIKDGTIAGSSLPDPSAILDLESNNKGLLLPRVALTDTALAAPLAAHVKGMVVYDTATNAATGITPGIYYNNGSKWIKGAAASSAWNTGGNTGTNAGASTVGNIADGNYIGTADAAKLALAVKGIKVACFDSASNALFNYGSTITGTSSAWNFVAGYTNAAINSSANTIFGSNNTVTSTSTNYGSANNFVAGSDNTARGWNNFIAGSSNALQWGMNACTVFGTANFIGTSYDGNNFVAGRYDTTAGVDYGALLGLGLKGINVGEMVVGSYNSPVSGALFTVGNGAGPSGQFPATPVARSNAFVVTRNNTAAASTNGIVIYSAALPVYTSDAQADSDATLPAGAYYKVTGSRAVYQKP